MSFSQENGYVPTTFSVVMEAIRLELNIQFGTTYTADSFIGTNWYKYFYTLVQRLLENETKTSEIFLKLSQYISTTNLAIQRPSVSLPGLLDSFAANGYVVAVRKNIVSDAGKIAIAVDVDNTDPDYAAMKLEICNLIKDFVVAGMFYEGTESELITLTNGQQFDFKFYLPTKTPIILRLTVTASDNQTVTLPTNDSVRLKLFQNINARYRLGWDFEPQRYFTQVDAPWAATILTEWSSNAGVTWHPEVFEAAYYDLFTFDLEDITVVITP